MSATSRRWPRLSIGRAVLAAAVLLGVAACAGGAALWTFFILFDQCLDGGCAHTVTEHRVAAAQLALAVPAVVVSVVGLARDWRRRDRTALALLAAGVAGLAAWGVLAVAALEA